MRIFERKKMHNEGKSRVKVEERRRGGRPERVDGFFLCYVPFRFGTADKIRSRNTELVY